MPRPESFGVEEMFGNGNDNVPVRGDFRVRLAAAERARSTRPLLPLRVSPIVAPVEERRPPSREPRGGKKQTSPAPGPVLRSDFRAFPSPSHRPGPREQATTAPPPPRADPTDSVIRRSAEWRSGGAADGDAGLSRDERDFLTELAAKRELVTDRARYAEVATAQATGQKPMPVARPATAPAAEGRSAATAARRAPTRERRETNATNARDSRDPTRVSLRETRRDSPPVLETRLSVSPNEPPSRRRVARRRRSPPEYFSTNAATTVSFAAARGDARRGDASPERSDETALGSAIKSRLESVSPTAERNATAPRRRALFARPGDARTLETCATETKNDTKNDENVRPATERDGTGHVERADEATASWRDSLRGARLRRAAARGGAEESSALLADWSPDASRRPAETQPEPARRAKTLLRAKSPKSPDPALEHLSAVRLTADERTFLARLAKERALITDRARHGAAAAAAGADPRRESPLRASLPDPIVAQPSPLVSPPPTGGAAADDGASRKTRSAAGASPARFARAAFGDNVAVAATRQKAPARRYGGASAAAGAVVTARWRPSPAREADRGGASRERPTTAAARMSREHARDMWRREPYVEENGFGFDVESAAPGRESSPNAGPNAGSPTRSSPEKTRDLATLEAVVARAETGAGPTPSSVSPARASFERARPPARASWAPGEAPRRAFAYRPDVYSRGLGVSISGVLGDARLAQSRSAAAETSRGPPGTRGEISEIPDPEWEWQGSWQREWQTSLESPDGAESGDAAGEDARRRGASSASAASPVSATRLDAPYSPGSLGGVSEVYEQIDSTPKGLAETIRARADGLADAEDSPAWTLSPSPERSGEKEGASAARRSSPASRRSPLSMSGPALDERSFESYRGAGSYRERRDARKASKAFGDEELPGGAARTGLDVRGDTSGAVFY